MNVLVFLLRESNPRQKKDPNLPLSGSVGIIHENRQLQARSGSARAKFTSCSKCHKPCLNMDCITDVIMNKYGYLQPEMLSLLFLLRHLAALKKASTGENNQARFQLSYQKDWMLTDLIKTVVVWKWLKSCSFKDKEIKIVIPFGVKVIVISNRLLPPPRWLYFVGLCVSIIQKILNRFCWHFKDRLAVIQGRID